MPDLSDLAPITAAAIIGSLFAFHNAPAMAEPADPKRLTLAEMLEQSTPMETCTAYHQDWYDNKYGADYLGSSAGKRKCECTRGAANYALDKGKISNPAIRETILTLTLDTNLQLTPSKKQSELLDALIAFDEGQESTELDFTSDELMEAIQTTASQMPDNATRGLTFVNELPACQQVVTEIMAAFPDVDIQAGISEENLAPMHRAMAIRALEYDPGVELQEIDAIISSQTPLALCKKYDVAYRLRHTSDLKAAEAEIDATAYCEHEFNNIERVMGMASENAKAIERRRFVIEVYMDAAAASSSSEDAITYMNTKHKAFNMSAAVYTHTVETTETLYALDAERRAEAKEAAKPHYCPADMDYNYASVDLPRALNKTYLP